MAQKGSLSFTSQTAYTGLSSSDVNVGNTTTFGNYWGLNFTAQPPRNAVKDWKRYE
jgi:hypothetical protein